MIVRFFKGDIEETFLLTNRLTFKMIDQKSIAHKQRF